MDQIQFAPSKTNPFIQPKRKKERGNGMLFALLGLVVMAIVTIPAINMFNDSTRNAKIEESKGQIQTIVSNAKKSYGAARQYGSVTTAMAINGNVIPEHMRVSATAANNNYDQPVGLNAQTIATAGDGLRLSYPVDPGECQDIVLSTEALARRVTVGTTVVKPTDGAADMAQLNTACNVDAPSVDLLLDFGFR